MNALSEPPVVPLRKGDGVFPLLVKEGLGEVRRTVRSMLELFEEDVFRNLVVVVDTDSVAAFNMRGR